MGVLIILHKKNNALPEESEFSDFGWIPRLIAPQLYDHASRLGYKLVEQYKRDGKFVSYSLWYSMRTL